MSLHSLQSRLNWLGGDANARIKKQKFCSFQSALLNDYNSRKVELPDKTIWPALLNLSNLKPDYDKKYISIAYESMLEPGDVIRTIDDNVHWMIYLPDLVETAYLRSEIIRCRYTLEIDEEIYWLYFQGPTETDIRWALNHGMTYNELNLSGTIFIKNNEHTKNYFSRFKKFKIAGHTWEAQVVDYISVPGIIEVEIQEYFDNIAEDLPEIKKQPPQLMQDDVILHPIIGSPFVKRKSVVGYTIAEDLFNSNETWKVIGNQYVKIKDTHLEGRICEIEIADCATGKFTICYGTNSFDVQIEAFYPEIIGQTEVYPYEFYEYDIHGVDGYFELFTPLARLVENDGNGHCKIEILTGKKGKFNLYFSDPVAGRKYELPIKVKSW